MKKDEDIIMKYTVDSIYFDNIYQVKNGRGKKLGYAWFCGKCGKIQDNILECLVECSHCKQTFIDKDIALQKARDRFGLWVN